MNFNYKKALSLLTYFFFLFFSTLTDIQFLTLKKARLLNEESATVEN